MTHGNQMQLTASVLKSAIETSVCETAKAFFLPWIRLVSVVVQGHL